MTDFPCCEQMTHHESEDGFTPQQPPVSFFIEGTPAPQGSKKAFVVKGRAIIVDDNKVTLKVWRALVTTGARAASLRLDEYTGALRVELDIYMPRGKTVTRARPSVKPDADKLTRSVLDGLTDSGIYGDDGQVVSLRVDEWYADLTHPVGVQIQIGASE